MQSIIHKMDKVKSYCIAEGIQYLIINYSEKDYKQECTLQVKTVLLCCISETTQHLNQIYFNKFFLIKKRVKVS